MKKFLVGVLATTLLSGSAFAYTEVTTESGFELALNRSKKYNIVLVHADWCGYCQDQKKILESLERKYENKVTFIRVDVDKNSYMQVSGVPVVILGKDKKPVKVLVGLRSEKDLEEALAEMMK